jgi:hypothetical protein
MLRGVSYEMPRRKGAYNVMRTEVKLVQNTFHSYPDIQHSKVYEVS